MSDKKLPTIQYEYTILHLLDHTWAEELRALGKDGWKLVTCIPATIHLASTDILILMRES